MYRLTHHAWRRGGNLMAALTIGAGSAALNANHRYPAQKDSSDGNEKSSLSDLGLSIASGRIAVSTDVCHCESIISPVPQTSEFPAFDLEQTYDIVRVLGEGAYGMVFAAKLKSNGKSVALKAMPREFTGQTDFEREVAALQLLSEKHDDDPSKVEKKDNSVVTGQDRIVKLYDLHRDDENYYLAMELVEGGELFDYLISRGPFSEGLAANFLRQFAEGISYTHSKGLVHADLKPENLLLTTTKLTNEGNEGEESSLKLVDFGCACTHDTSKKDLQLPIQEFAFGCSFLHMVALGNQFELQRMLMERPSLVNFRDYDFRTPLHLAASEGHVDICRFLVAKGAKINRTDRWGGSPLDDAHRHKHTDVLKYLREHGGKFGNVATQMHKFIEAAGAGDVNEVTALLEYGTALDVNQGDYDRRTALHLACSEGRLEMVELLVGQEGVDVDVEDRWGNRPMDDAKHAKQHSAEIVKLLKTQGARPKKSTNRKKSSIDNEMTPTSSGTIVYWPPEMFLKDAKPSPAIDMWAVGVIMYMVLTGSHPFDKFADKSDDEIKEIIVKLGSSDKCGLLDEIVFDERADGLYVQYCSDISSAALFAIQSSSFLSWYCYSNSPFCRSASCIDLMRQLMHPDPKQRMTSEDLLRHPWIQGLTANWKTMDKTYSKHLQRVFKKDISKQFDCKDGGGVSNTKLREIFNTIDIAHNGVLDANELRVILRRAGEPEDIITNIVSSLNFQRQGGTVKGVHLLNFRESCMRNRCKPQLDGFVFILALLLVNILYILLLLFVI
ncbi:hypothetical protein ACHAXR_005935 [Thalassiosira sp. AJA248-18]